jgi:hypothetical protein
LALNEDSKLADTRREGEAQRILRIVVKDAEERPSVEAPRQTAAEAIEHDQRVVAIGA